MILHKAKLHIIQEASKLSDEEDESYIVAYRQRTKGKDLIKIGIVSNPHWRRYGIRVLTHYEPATDTFWNHRPEFATILRSGEWESLPILDTSNFEIID